MSKSKRSVERTIRLVRPVFDRFEERALLSVGALFARGAVMTAERAAALVAAGPHEVGAPQVSAQSLIGATPTGQPTPAEIAREHFSALFHGLYTTGPGRFTNEALRTHIVAPGTTNQFLHGNAIFEFITPLDPSQPETGIVALYNRNSSNTGTILVLDLTGTPPAIPTQPPTHFTWNVDPASGGAYTGATGSGTLTLAYKQHGRLQPHSYTSGSAAAVFSGSVNTVGVFNIIQFSGR